MNKLVALIEHFIPDSLRAKPENLTRARFLVSYLFILGGLALVYNLIYFKVGNHVGGWAILGMAALIFSLPHYLRRSGNLNHTMYMCSVGMTLMNGAIMFSSGGVQFSGNPWWAIAPVFTTLVSGGRAGRSWLIAVACLVGGTYIAELMGVKVPNLIVYDGNESWIHFLDWFHYFGVIFVLTAAAMVFDLINRQALASEKENRTKVEEAGRISEEHSSYLDDSVVRILSEMERLAAGDLRSRLTIVKDDAIGQLCEGYNRAVLRMHGAIEDVSQAVKVTANSSDLIGRSTGNLSQDAGKQTEKAGQIADSTSQIVELITENAENARRTADTARENGTLASEGGDVVRQTMGKMEVIAQRVSETSVSIEALGRSTREIGKIVVAIDNIAERTNLLALNAAIEASHAGALGRGFGVIAEEVKALAGQTTVETERIAKMIDSVQKEAMQAVREMEEGNEQVELGKALASKAGDALDRIVESSANVFLLIQNIADACEEQTNQSELLFQQIEDLKTVTDDSAVDIGEIASSARNLGKLTGDVKSLLDRFRLNG